jgi:hypothetical protein
VGGPAKECGLTFPSGGVLSRLRASQLKHLVNDGCMCPIDIEAYEALARRKRKGESFSPVIKEHFRRRSMGRDLNARLPAVRPLGGHSGEAGRMIAGCRRDRANPPICDPPRYLIFGGPSSRIRPRRGGSGRFDPAVFFNEWIGKPVVELNGIEPSTS